MTGAELQDGKEGNVEVERGVVVAGPVDRVGRVGRYLESHTRRKRIPTKNLILKNYLWTFTLDKIKISALLHVARFSVYRLFSAI